MNVHSQQWKPLPWIHLMLFQQSTEQKGTRVFSVPLLHMRLYTLCRTVVDVKMKWSGLCFGWMMLCRTFWGEGNSQCLAFMFAAFWGTLTYALASAVLCTKANKATYVDGYVPAHKRADERAGTDTQTHTQKYTLTNGGDTPGYMKHPCED